jgi:hypothetical protein
MFLSKIWFFLVTVIAAVCITIALTMPRPAERASLVQENKNVRSACQVTNILLKENARERIQLTLEFAQAIRELKLSSAMVEASKGDISGQENATARNELNKLITKVSGTKPSFIWLLDRRGRVIARSSVDDKTYGDSVQGFFAVKDALDGYVRDDLWLLKDGLYRVAAAPVLTKDLQWAGAIVVGHTVNKDFATDLSKSISANINFYVANDAVASSHTAQIHKDVLAGAAELANFNEGEDCAASEVLRVEAGEEKFFAVSARLPGEAGLQGGFYTVYAKQSKPLNFMGTLKSVKKDDLGFDRFPWVLLAILFVAMLGIGVFLMFFEVDKPLKKLTKEAVALAEEEKERFDENAHRSRYGSIARSVNIRIDKMQRATKAAKKDIDQLLGPTGNEAGSTALPPIGLGQDLSVPAPPPSEFKFGAAPTSSDLGLTPPPPAAMPSDMPGLTPPPERITPPPKPNLPPVPSAKKPPIPSKTPKPPAEQPDVDTTEDSEPPTNSEAYFERIYQDFLAMKEKCGESTENLTFEKFSKKLQTNRDALMKKRSCSAVKFQVYEKDGKAALKASPVK